MPQSENNDGPSERSVKEASDAKVWALGRRDSAYPSNDYEKATLKAFKKEAKSRGIDLRKRMPNV